MDPKDGKPTFREKLDFVFCFGGVGFVIVRACLRYLCSAAAEVQPTLGREVGRSVGRWVLDRFNVAQIQWVLPDSTAVYKEWIAKQSKGGDTPTEVVTESIGDGAKLHWIGQINAKKVLLHYHGGGFVLPLTVGHLNLLNYFRREIKRRSGIEVRVAFPEYTLAPMATYPLQYRQAVLALQHILASGISPADIVIAGDSAGAMLVFQVLSHLLYPHPSLPVITIPAITFAGILTISSWVVFDSSASSFVHNVKDTLTSRALSTWGRTVRQGTILADGGNENGGYWGEPLKAPPHWWRDTCKVTHNMLITYGQWEAFRDDNVAFTKQLKEGVMGTKIDIQVVEEPKGMHISPTVDAEMGRPPTELTTIITGWVHDRVLD